MEAQTLSSSGAIDQAECPAQTGQVADKLFYNNGVLKWDGGQLKDDDIITVTRANSCEVGTTVGYTIFSLEPADPSGPTPPTPFKLNTTPATAVPEAFLNKHLFQGLPAHLNPAANALRVLISTLSGTGLSPQFFDDILEPVLGTIGLKSSDYDVVRTQSAESVKEFAQSELLVRANEGKKQTVLMLSGDGGMVDTINGLLESGERSRYIFKTSVSPLLFPNCQIAYSALRTARIPNHFSRSCLSAQATLSSTPSTSRPLSLLYISKVFEHFYTAHRDLFPSSVRPFLQALAHSPTKPKLPHHSIKIPCTVQL